MSRDEAEKKDRIRAFDALFTTNHIQIYKLLLPYLDPSLQQQLAVYIKYLEFQYTAAYFKHHPFGCMPREILSDTTQLYHEILPYCSYAERKKVERLIDIFSTLKNAEEMMETVNMMKEIFPEGFHFGDGDGGAEDFMQMFQMLSK
ncbi:MAG: hypothetical protein J1E65_00815 [Lachnospiraceae bacterium]|nr:hypothetical protein [Lachnospiraceae bacterium]